LCIFHDKDYLDKDYLQNKGNEYVIADYDVHKLQVLARLKHKVKHAISNNQPLFCIGFQLADFSLSDLGVSKEFTKPVYFNESLFFGKADFSRALLKGGADFIEAKFQAQGVVNEFSFESQSFTQ
jgi:hypothetical protein